jgi:hypothetical protein
MKTRPGQIRLAHGHPTVTIGSSESRAARREPDGSGNATTDLDRRLDLALKETSPASDPVSIFCS